MKKLLIGIGIVLAILIGIIVYSVLSLDDIVKGAIETYGSQAIGTKVRVEKVSINLKNGVAVIRGLRVANPGGFSTHDIFTLAMIRVEIDTDSVLKNPVVLDKVIVRNPEFFYEINRSGQSNVDVLKKRLTPGGAKAKAGKGPAPAREQVKMIIRRLVVENGRATVKIAALGGKQQRVGIPRIVLTDVGKKSGGATAVEVARILGAKLVKNIQISVAGLGVKKYLRKPAELLKNGLPVDAGPLGRTLEKSIGGKLKGLLGR